MIAQLWLILFLLLAPVVAEQPPEVPVTPAPSFSIYSLRYFRDGDEIRDYLAGRPVLMPIDGQNCVDLARFFTQDARRAGFDVFPAYLDALEAAAYGFSGRHMLVMALTQDAIYYIEPSTNRLWWVSP